MALMFTTNRNDLQKRSIEAKYETPVKKTDSSNPTGLA